MGGSSMTSYRTLVHALSGAAGSVTAMTVFFPLDTARIRLQVDDNRECRCTPLLLAEIIREEGLLALYRGWFPVISSLCCSNFVYFYTFHTLKATWGKGNTRASPGRDLVMGCIAGAVNVLITTPMWVVNTRLKLQGAKFRNKKIHQTCYKGMLDAFQQIAKQEGVKTLWNGILPSLFLVMNPAVQFMLYEGLKRKAMKGGRKISSLEIFLMGALAKGIATTITYPLQIVQAVLRFGQSNTGSQRTFLGSFHTVLYLVSQRIKRHGLLGLYKGLEAKLLQTVLTAALMFLVYERIVGATFKIMGLS
ncbi:peroxisomal membrane protein PMP34 [Callorhinchus milii]|nr:peroxisomal membrane protein PMP34 [Callorhinchus milii]|eukprot:gi/632952390/ref/XP_007891825.1/ PREDICTED: peroxisomal membrane protein PMP34-like [Callorhinchus milii]